MTKYTMVSSCGRNSSVALREDYKVVIFSVRGRYMLLNGGRRSELSRRRRAW